MPRTLSDEPKNATGVAVTPMTTAYNCMKNCALYGSVRIQGPGEDNENKYYDIKVYPLYADKINSIENCIVYQTFTKNGNDGSYEKDVDEGVKHYTGDAQLQNEAEDICKEFNGNSKEIHWGVNSTYPKYPLPIACGGEITDLYGSGTALDPYWISSEKSLRRLQELVASKKFPTKDKYFYLAADIDMTDSKPMEPIGISDESENTMFMGTFYGNGHAIIGMHTNDDGYGLFRYVGGTIQDLAVIGMTGKVASPLVYYLKGSEAKIQSCYVGGDIDFIKEGAGLCYHSDSGSSITNSYFKGTAHTPEKAKFAGICYSNNSMIDNCFASFNVETDEKVETDDDVQAQCIATTGTGIVNGCYGYINKVSEGVTKHYDSVVKEINSESDLNGLMKSPFVEGAYHPILLTTKHYDDVIFSYKTGNSDGDTNTKLAKLDAIPTDDGTNCISRYVPDAVSYNYNYKEDRLLWSLPNLAIYDAESNTDYLLNCTLNPEQGFVYNTYDKNGKKVENLNIKGSINFPLTLTGDADTYMLCLPGVVHKDNLPEGSRLMIVGKATELEKSCQANVVDCDSIPAGMPFLAYIPGEEGDVVNIVMRGDIATGPRTAIKVNGEWFNTDLTGSFLKWGGFNNSFTSVKGNQLIKSEEQTPGNLPAFSSAYILQNNNFTWTVIDLINYILLDETAADVDDIVKNYNDKNGINVKLKRSLKKGSWNTICLPFDVSGDDMKAFGADGNTTVEELTSVDSNDGVCTLHFTKATGIEAGKSYLIKQDADYPMVLEWNSRTIKNGFHSDPKTVTGLDGFNTVTFTGSFAPTYLVGDSSEDGVCFIQGDKIYKVGDGQHIAMKGFRCWLTTSNVDVLKSARLVHSDGSTTDLRMVEIGSCADGSRIYDLQGIETVSPTKAGVYIKNGKKYVER